MRISGFAISCVLWGTFLTQTVWGQDSSAEPLPAAPAAAFHAESVCEAAGHNPCEVCPCSSCQSACTSGLFGCYRRWQARDPWTLPQPYLLQRLGIKTGGWLQGGITMNAEHPGDRSNGPLLTNDRHGEFQMNQLWLYFNRPCDTSDGGWDIGGRVDILYGTDWRCGLAHGLGFEDRINGSDRLYGLSLPQFYAELAVDRLSVKIGRMAGILGYESVVPMFNPFYTLA